MDDFIIVTLYKSRRLKAINKDDIKTFYQDSIVVGEVDKEEKPCVKIELEDGVYVKVKESFYDIVSMLKNGKERRNERS